VAVLGNERSDAWTKNRREMGVCSPIDVLAANRNLYLLDDCAGIPQRGGRVLGVSPDVVVRLPTSEIT
jgi:hypothetical protein